MKYKLRNLVLIVGGGIPTQKEIAHLLGTLDDKIELNRKMNKTLEEIAQTLYKHWFIDFYFPNEDGKPYKSSGGEMIDTELGPFPKGWRVGSISDVVERLKVSRRHTKTELYANGIVPVYDQSASEILGYHNGTPELDKLDFDTIYCEDWRDNDQYQYYYKKSTKCAEVLVPHIVQPLYISGAYVGKQIAKELLKCQEFPLTINLNPRMFFAE